MLINYSYVIVIAPASTVQHKQTDAICMDNRLY